MGRLFRYIFAVEDNLPGGKRLKPSDRVEQRGLTGTIRTDEPGNASGLDGNRNIVQRNVAAELHFYVDSFKQRHRLPPLGQFPQTGQQHLQDRAHDPSRQDRRM